MKRRYILYRRKRGGMFYIEDTETRKQESTGTRNRAEATSVLNARNESIRQPHLNLQIAKAYLAGTDSGVATRILRQTDTVYCLSGPNPEFIQTAPSLGTVDQW
jgi:hypothetical protein